MMTAFMFPYHWGINRFFGRMGMPMWGGFIPMFLFWLLIIIGIGYLVKKMNDNNKVDYQRKRHDITPKASSQNEDRDRDPVELARLRYARGEIDREELEEILEVLKETEE